MEKRTVYSAHLFCVAPKRFARLWLNLDVREEEDIIGPHTLLPKDFSNLFWCFQEIEGNVGSVLRETTRNGRRTARETVNVAPSMRCLRKNAHHIVSGDAIGASDNCCEAAQGLWIHRKAMIDADVADLVHFFCHVG